MRRRWAYLLLMVVVGVLLPTGLAAQENWTDEDFVMRNHPFLDSRNPAGLYGFERKSLSQACLYYNKSNGGLVNFHQSDNAYLFFLGARSIYRLSPSVVLRGEISYENGQGLHQSGSVLMDPYYNTFDLLEITDANQGIKKTEQYHVRTDLSWRVWKGLSFGASFDFISANYSKMKDLRHSNVFSDMKLDLGTTWDFNGKAAIGAAYHFRKSVEGISFERFSSGDLHYELLISYGSFWGKRKSFEENMGQISKMRTPILNIFHGGSLQVELTPVPAFGLYLEGTCSSRKCEYGHKSPNTVLYNSFKGLDYAARVEARLQTARDCHHLRFSMSGRPTTSYESVYKTVHHSSGENETRYFDPKEVSKSDDLTWHIDYTGFYRANDNLPAGSFKAGFLVHDRTRLTSLYPYYREERMLPFAVYTQGRANISKGKNLFSPGLGLLYAGSLAAGWADGSFIPDATQLRPKDAPQMQGREWEYVTSPKVQLSPSFRYSRLIRRFALWVEADYSWLRALVPLDYLSGAEHHSVTLSIGLDF